jgi:hypothetical protein
MTQLFLKRSQSALFCWASDLLFYRAAVELAVGVGVGQIPAPGTETSRRHQ